jgi:hypothetical protein
LKETSGYWLSSPLQSRGGGSFELLFPEIRNVSPPGEFTYVLGAFAGGRTASSESAERFHEAGCAFFAGKADRSSACDDYADDAGKRRW